MKTKHILTGLLLLSLYGCNADDNGNVKAAEAASKAAPKTVADLPKDMPPEARAAAQAGMGQQKAAEEHMSKEGEAMKRARASSGG